MKRSAFLIILCIIILGINGFGQNTRRRPAVKGGAKPTAKKPAVKKPAVDDRLPQTPPPPIGESDEEIIVDTNLVTTPVTVLDRNGRFIGGLQKKDFRIFEDGVPQAVTHFQSEQTPFTVILMIDISPSTRYSIDDIRYAAVTFVNQLRPDDRVMVVNFDRQVRVMTEPTNDKKALFTAIYKSQFGSGTSLYEAVDAAMSMDFVQSPGRKAVVVFTDGVDTTSRGSSYESTVSAVEEVDALIYPIRYDTQQTMDQSGGQIAALQTTNLPANVVAQLGRGSTDVEYETGRLYLNTIAENSGGRIFEAGSMTNLEAAFKGVADELRQQYAVGYYPDDTGKPGDRKKIKIEVNRPKAVVRSKTTYVIKGPPETPASGSQTDL